MGKQIRAWAEKDRKREEDFAAEIARHSAKVAANKNVKPSPSTYLLPRMDTYRFRWVRQFEDWESKLKTHNVKRKQIELLRFLFQKYPTPGFLEEVWFSDGSYPNREPSFSEFIPWYLAVAQGESLFKTCAKGYLTKKECFFFIKASSEFNIIQNMWWAKAMALGATVGAANNIARSKLRNHTPWLKDEFWYTVAMFFVRYPMSPNKIDDIIDFIVAKRTENPQFTMHGRTPATFAKHLEEWHRFLAKQKQFGNERWDGVDLPDWTYEAGSEENPIFWTFHQIKTGKELVSEGSAMHHCVASYRNSCVNGRCSIWGVSRHLPKSFETKKRLTIELDKGLRIVQARGFANRMPKGDEIVAMQKWVSEFAFSGFDRYLW